MRKQLVLLLVFSSIQLIAQTSTPGATAPSKKPVTKATSSQPTAIIETTAGKMTCTLFPDKAPMSVANFIGLAKGTKNWTDPKTGHTMHGVPLYNGTIFHRVIPEFMIQGGDPLGNGTGDPGYRFKDELRPDLTYDKPGRLAYANSGPNTNGSQFFITEQEQPGLDPCFDEGGCRRGSRFVPKGTGYTIFGQCDDATVELVKKIARMPRNESNDLPHDPVKITKITILHASGATTHAPAHMPKPKPVPQGTKQQ